LIQEIFLLTTTAATIGLVHTVLGPDHYIPFIAMSKSGNWTKRKTVWVTIAAGIGHVLSSVVLGIIGLAIGITISTLEFIEAFRGEVASWLLISFGMLYLLWGIRAIIKNKKHSHIHLHEDGTLHSHPHKHSTEHLHIHNTKKVNTLTPWIIFTIFLFGPCEPLIPLLMFPASGQNVLTIVLVAMTFAVTTIGTMLIIVMGSVYGLKFVSIKRAEKYSHAIAGMLILVCGLSIKFLGL
jgi:sulfite exporter TauE/SafE